MKKVLVVISNSFFEDLHNILSQISTIKIFHELSKTKEIIIHSFVSQKYVRLKAFYAENDNLIIHFLFLLIGQTRFFWRWAEKMNKINGGPSAGYIAARNQHLSGFSRVLTQSNLLEYFKLISSLQTKTFPQGQCLRGGIKIENRENLGQCPNQG